jgi:hypothetical protein
MAITNGPVTSDVDGRRRVSGDVMAAILGAGLGAFAIGLVVILNEIGAFTPPTLYGPAGGVSGRTTLAAIVWLAAWGVLHFRWRKRQVAPTKIFLLTLILVVLGIAGIFPPVWGLL